MEFILGDISGVVIRAGCGVGGCTDHNSWEGKCNARREMTDDEKKYRLHLEVIAGIEEVKRHLSELWRMDQEDAISKPKLEPGTVWLCRNASEARALDFALQHYLMHVEIQIKEKYHPRGGEDRSAEWEEILGRIRVRLRSLGDWDKTTDVRAKL